MSRRRRGIPESPEIPSNRQSRAGGRATAAMCRRVSLVDRGAWSALSSAETTSGTNT